MSKATTVKARPETTILADIRQIYMDLSPENLSWDGERSLAQQRQAAKVLKARLQGCFKELGRKVPEGEVFRY